MPMPIGICIDPAMSANEERTSNKPISVSSVSQNRPSPSEDSTSTSNASQP